MCIKPMTLNLLVLGSVQGCIAVFQGDDSHNNHESS